MPFANSQAAQAASGRSGEGAGRLAPWACLAGVLARLGAWAHQPVRRRASRSNPRRGRPSRVVCEATGGLTRPWAAGTMPAMETCPHCGAPLPQVPDAFCPECRVSLDEAPERPVPPAERAERRRAEKYLFWRVAGCLLAVAGLANMYFNRGLVGTLLLAVGLGVLLEAARRGCLEP
jgi:hypothetical protein